VTRPSFIRRVVAFSPPEAADQMAALDRRQPKLFDGIPWSTSETRAATLARARDLGLSVLLLPRWFDVDTPEDLRRLCADPAARDTAPRTAAFLATLAG
jgi:hypothetical protein